MISALDLRRQFQLGKKAAMLQSTFLVAYQPVLFLIGESISILPSSSSRFQLARFFGIRYPKQSATV
jgi:hypothetical protein